MRSRTKRLALFPRELSPPPLKFLADESCDFGVVRALRQSGHDVLAVCEVARLLTIQRSKLRLRARFVLNHIFRGWNSSRRTAKVDRRLSESRNSEKASFSLIQNAVPGSSRSCLRLMASADLQLLSTSVYLR
jgi:hypothetical protein